MAMNVHCPSCEHVWEEDYFEEDDINVYKEKIEALTANMAEMREFLKNFVDEFDKTPSVYLVNRVLTKAEIQKMRRLVENA